MHGLGFHSELDGGVDIYVHHPLCYVLDVGSASSGNTKKGDSPGAREAEKFIPEVAPSA